MNGANNRITFENVSKFYGDVLGVNRVNLSIPPGVTGLVGPMARSESLELVQALGRQGLQVIISSHILHEVDKMSDQVVLMSSGYVVAEGQIHAVRTEVKEHPMQVLVRCSDPNLLASRVFAQDHVVEAKLNDDGKGVLVRTRDADAFYLLLNRLVVEDNISLETVAPADDDVNSVYQYLIGSENKTI